MTSPDRTARSVLAYERGARLAGRMASLSVLIGLVALVLGGGVVWWAGIQLDESRRLTSEEEEKRGEAEKATERALTVLEATNDLNARLVSLGTIVADLDTKNASGTQFALDEIQALIDLAGNDTATKPTVLKLSAMRVGIYANAGNFADALMLQSELNALDPNQYRILDLAILQCRAGAFDAAQTTLLDSGLTRENTALIKMDERVKTACGERFNSLASTLSADDGKVDGHTTDPGDGPEIPSATPEPAAPAVAITQVFLHIKTEGQRASAAAIGKGLCDAGYDMPGIQLVPEPRYYPSTARVIFYYADQTKDAVSIARKVERIAGGLGLTGYDVALDARIYRSEGLPHDRVEIWFAEDAPATESEESKTFKCVARAAQ